MYKYTQHLFMNTSTIIIIGVTIIFLLIIQILNHRIINSISIRIIVITIIVSLTINPLVFPCFWGMAGLVFGW